MCSSRVPLTEPARMDTMQEMDDNANKVTLLNLNLPDEKNEPNPETCLITVQDVGDTKIKERKRRRRMKSLALYFVCIAVCVSAVTIVGYFISQLEIRCLSATALMIFSSATMERYKKEVTDYKQEIPGSDKVYIDLEKTAMLAISLKHSKNEVTEEKHEIPGSDKVNHDFEKVHRLSREENPLNMSTVASPGAITASINGLSQQEKQATEAPCIYIFPVWQ
ncbi:hypothetical protein CHS0354_026853 [Potamilus streckersoni]|uniref:Uncharacterized protein n=1 Tax=Potamilus streckersoni TaxID=2493646 RepID=A0AAE0VYS2_9BIVA|nr:hypothetical protein CHS0354_026853 [Potamilus streckersoni]